MNICLRREEKEEIKTCWNRWVFFFFAWVFLLFLPFFLFLLKRDEKRNKLKAPMPRRDGVDRQSRTFLLASTEQSSVFMVSLSNIWLPKLHQRLCCRTGSLKACGVQHCSEKVKMERKTGSWRAPYLYWAVHPGWCNWRWKTHFTWVLPQMPKCADMSRVAASLACILQGGDTARGLGNKPCL